MLRQAQHERIWVRSLVPHPSAQPVAIEDIEVHLAPGALSFIVRGATPLVPPPARPVRTDGLWRTTCFELFVRPGGGLEYYEFNFSPSTAWAAYRFDDYRSGMCDHPVPAPVIEPIENGIRVMFDAGLIDAREATIGLSAVIEETDGTKSYWALRHPPGAPDFHHPDCFALELPAVDPS